MPFEGKKGLRQRSISPYLFIVCIEYLNRCMLGLNVRDGFNFHPRCMKLNLTHVCFADDLLRFSIGDINSVSNLFKSFNFFSEASGLKANQAKRSIFFGGVALSVQIAIMDVFHLPKGDV